MLRSSVMVSTVAILSLACASLGPEAKQPVGTEQPLSRPKTKKPRKKPLPEPTDAPPVSGPADVVVQVRADGSFHPPDVTIEAGQTVEWVLADPQRQSIAPLRSTDSTRPCDSIAAFRGDAVDLTGPMPRSPGGLFVLNQDGPGLKADGTVDPTAPLGAVTDASWRSERNTGAFLRLRWNWLQPDGPGAYDWTILDREVQKAVANGKLYSIGIKAGFHGTPQWIFEAGVDKLTFREFGTHDGVDACKCGAFFELGSPTQPRYQELYFEMLEAVAEHLRSNAAWYRHLAYVKPSGANLYSVENRLPKRCSCAEQCVDQRCKTAPKYKNAPNLDASGRICNTRVWAESGYTPEGLLQFYARQFDVLAQAFPDKDLLYLLIHDGFPRVAGPDAYLGCGEGKDARGVPPPVTQTRAILERGWDRYGERFSTQHAGLGHGKDINNLLMKERRPTQFIALQTNNDVLDAAALQATVTHGMDQSEHAMVIEVYEEAALDDARASHPDLNQRLHARRQAASHGRGAHRDAFPAVHRHTFAGPGAVQLLNPATCGSSSPATSVVRIE